MSVYTTRPDLAGGALCEASFTLAAENDIAAAANKVTSVTSSSTPQLGGRLTITVVGDTGTIGAAGKFTATPASYASWPANAYRLTGSRITMTGGNTGVHTDVLYLSGLNSSSTDYTAEFTFAVVGTTASTTAVSPMTHISSGTQVKHTSTSNFGNLPAIPQVVNTTTLAMSGSPGSLPSQGGTGTYTVTITNTGGGASTLDDVVVTLPVGTSYVPGSATFAGTTTPDPSISGSTATFLSGLTVPASSSRTLTLQVTVPGTPGAYTASATGHIAAVAVDSTLGTGDSAPPTAGITVAGPAPTVTGLSPTTGPAAGGTNVTITGTTLTGATAVTFGNQPATGFTVVNPTTITAVTPPGSGAVDVTVTTPNGTSAVVPAGVFTYQAPPVQPPTPANLTSTGTGTTAQTATVTIPAGGTATLLDAQGNPTAGAVTVTGQGSYSLSGTTITFTPVLGFTGQATPVGYRVTDQYQQSGNATYTPTVNPPAAPNPGNLTSTGTGTAAQTATITIPAGTSATLLDGQGNPTAGNVTVTGQGSYSLSGTTITFTPVLGFAGQATPVAYRITDAYNQSGDATYTPTVNPPAAPNPGNLTSTGTGTAAQTSTVTIPAGMSATLLDGQGNPTAGTVTVTGQGGYSLSGTTITFTPVLGFAGQATPVAYRITDAYNQSGDATYTPTVNPPAAPNPPNRTSTGVSPATQSVTITLPANTTPTLLDTQGNPIGGPVTITGEGAYTLSGATITFTPQQTFTGTATPVTYRLTDAYNQHGDATYTPTVTAGLPNPPQPSNLTSTGTGTTAQTVTVTIPTGGTATLLDTQGNPTAGAVTVTGQGSYSLSGTTITFTPVLGFTGQATPVGYRVTDQYQQSGNATYTPTVNPPTAPNPGNLTSTGTGTAAQTATITIPAGGSATLLDGQASPTAGTVTVAGQGGYSLSGTTITFTPVLGFAGQATPVAYRITDAYNQSGDATYTPTVNPPAPPTAANLTSTGQGVQEQTAAVTAPAGGAVRLLDGGNPVTDLTVDDTGAFAVTSAALTFTPEFGYLGQTTVTYRRTDAYGQHATATYTATVTAPPPPAAPDRTTRGVGTTPQSTVVPVPPGGTIALLDAADNPVSQVTFAGKGTYRLQLIQSANLLAAAPRRAGALRATALTTGAKIVFTAVLGYKGTAPAVDYQVTDAYGQTATATYTPTVVLPPPPASPPQTSTGPQTNPQQVTLPVPPGGTVTLIDATGNPVTTLTIPGQGTYTLNPTTGVLIFTPLPNFTGQPDPVTYQLTDAYGQTSTATYTPAVIGALPVTGTGAPTNQLATTGLLLLLLGALLTTATQHKRPTAGR
ncbi:beta strand repeat-containing protein [Pilimelia terevasa]|uniref:beta strand repeat-containing protein n=1 Tax=Pilimelia terevasa TaxID=53372 RepID=UPI00166E55EA|nr:IPT/TIG domain-containing protein [Pilimelia terevasa]